MIRCLAAGVASCAIAPAQAATTENWYGGLSGDLTWLRHSDTGGGGNVDLGYRFDDFRVEAEAGYHGAGGQSGFGSTHYFTYMGNAYYDFNHAFSSDSRIVPYIGAGLGDAAVHFGNSSFTTTFHHHENIFAYQGMAGLEYSAANAPNTTWSLGYRYLGTDSHNLHANNLELGVRLHF